MTTRANRQAVTLRDGRRLGYLETGPRDGLLVLYLHGAIGSPQRSGDALDAVAVELGVRYVMVSRPGFADSDPLPGRTLLDFASDAAELADLLGHTRFAVLGVSAGGPYALACAHELRERVAAAAVVSSMSWSDGARRTELPARLRLGLRALRGRPAACARVGDALVGILRSRPSLVARVIAASAPAVDRRALEVRASRELAAARFLTAAGAGIGGMIDDHLLCAGDWGFSLSQVHTQVRLWHGIHDEIVPVDAALQLAASLPRVQTSLHPDEGHFFYERRLREILGDLARACDAAAAPPRQRLIA